MLVPAAHGYTIDGERWPGPTVAVWNDTPYAKGVGDAIRSWNAAGAAIRLVPAHSRDTADVVVRDGAGSRRGEAAVGYGGGPSTVMLARGLTRLAAAALAAHELGHILGLGHERRRCAVMAPVVAVGAASRCGIGACASVWRCLVRADDAVGLIALYGRAARPS